MCRPRFPRPHVLAIGGTPRLVAWRETAQHCAAKVAQSQQQEGMHSLMNARTGTCRSVDYTRRLHHTHTHREGDKHRHNSAAPPNTTTPTEGCSDKRRDAMWGPLLQSPPQKKARTCLTSATPSPPPLPKATLLPTVADSASVFGALHTQHHFLPPRTHTHTQGATGLLIHI